MTLFKNTIFIALLLLFSFKLSKCQETGFLGELATITEDTLIEEVVAVEAEEEGQVVEEPFGETAITIVEETAITEAFPPDTQVDYAEEETREETTTTRVEEFPITEGEITTTEETPYEWSEGELAITEISSGEAVETVEVDEQEQEDVGEEETAEAPLLCPEFIEETEVDGYWMTFHPCCVLPGARCDDAYEPVCIERVRCEGDHCRWHYETVVNVCNACGGHEDWQYSKGKCPWDESDKIW